MKHIITLILLLSLFNYFGQDIFKVGDDVKVNWKEGGTFYPGTISEIKDGLYFIKYDDGDTEWAKVEQLKVNTFEWPENNAADKSTKFKANDKVDVEENGIWYDATVLKSNEGQYFIHYDGWSSSYDVVVNNERIRTRTKKDKPTTPSNMTTGGTSGSGSSGNGGSGLIHVSIQNTCLQDAVMLIDGKEYTIRKNSALELDLEEGTFVYGLNGSKKVLKGTVSTSDYMNRFTPLCD
jgi:hypothetical protein